MLLTTRVLRLLDSISARQYAEGVQIARSGCVNTISLQWHSLHHFGNPPSSGYQSRTPSRTTARQTAWRHLAGWHCANWGGLIETPDMQLRLKTWREGWRAPRNQRGKKSDIWWLHFVSGSVLQALSASWSCSLLITVTMAHLGSWVTGGRGAACVFEVRMP